MASPTIAQYKSLEELQAYADAQLKTITQLAKKVQRLEEERDHLKKLLEDSVPLIKTQPEGVTQIAESDSEYICTVEIAKLKNITSERELTYEETRKLSEYFKILTQINARSKNTEREVENLPTEELLKLAQSDGNGTK